MQACPRCGAALEALTGCAACGSVLDVDRSATPFELLGFEPAFALDVRELKKRHLRASRLAHPDFFGTAAPDARALAERNAALLNGAFETLVDDARRADWLVEHLGGPSENEERAMPKQFLLEALEWNELLEEARSSPSFDARLATLERELAARRAAAITSVALLLTPLPERASPLLREARAHLNSVRYLDRALADVESQRLAKPAAR